MPNICVFTGVGPVQHSHRQPGILCHVYLADHSGLPHHVQGAWLVSHWLQHKLCVYKYMCLFMCVYVCVCAWVVSHLLQHNCVCICACVFVCVCMCVGGVTFVAAQLCVYICVCVCVYVRERHVMFAS
jgi:hypothetical protein